MTRLAIIFSLLFVTPAGAINTVCYDITITPEKDAYQKIINAIKTKDCDVLTVMSVGDAVENEFMKYIARFCRYDRQIVVNKMTKRIVEFSCVPEKERINRIYK